jgi:hypothetical protein
MCGDSPQAAIAWLEALEEATRPPVARTGGIAVGHRSINA